MEKTATVINEFGSITGDDITKIFEDLGKKDIIQSIGVTDIYESIISMKD